MCEQGAPVLAAPFIGWILAWLLRRNKPSAVAFNHTACVLSALSDEVSHCHLSCLRAAKTVQNTNADGGSGGDGVAAGGDFPDSFAIFGEVERTLPVYAKNAYSAPLSLHSFPVNAAGSL